MIKRYLGPRSAVLLGLAVLSGAADTSLRAQEPTIDTPYRWIERSTRFGGGLGYLVASRGSLELGPGSTPTAAGRFRIRFSSPLSFEISTTYGPADRFVVDPLAEGGPSVVDTVRAHWLLIDAGVQFAFTGNRTWNGLQPYLLVGFGLQIGLTDDVNAIIEENPELEPFVFKIGTAPSALIGLGTEWLLSSRVGLGLEVRDHLWRLKAPDGFFLPEVLDRFLETGAPAPQESQWTNNFEFGLTLWYYL